MTIAPSLPDPKADMRARRCIVSGNVLPEGDLVRFVIGPGDEIVPDVAAKLPGRGIWVSSSRDTLERALAKGHFSRAARTPVSVSANLPTQVEALLVARMSGDLGLARRAGEIVLGFEAVGKALAGPRPPAVLVEASDGASDGRRKLSALVREKTPAIIDCLTVAELSLALGRGNVVHAALKSGRLSERLLQDAGRLCGFRPAPGRALARSAAESARNTG